MSRQALAPIPAPSYDTVTPHFETTCSSEGRGWKNLQVYCYKLEPQLEPVAIPIVNAHTIPVLLTGRCEATTLTDGRALRAQVYPGSMTIMPSGVPTATSWTHAIVMSHLYLSSAFVTTSAEDLSQADPELVPHSYFRDPFVEQVCLALVSELEAGGPLGALYADTLAQALSLHLLRHHSTVTVTRDPPSRGLSRRRLKLVIDFIDDYLATDLSIDNLAVLAGLSPAYFTRQFKAATGLPPHQYLIHRRVERAKELLIHGGLSVAEVAQAVGFFDQSHLNRHFKLLLKVSPGDVLKNSRNVLN